VVIRKKGRCWSSKHWTDAFIKGLSHVVANKGATDCLPLRATVAFYSANHERFGRLHFRKAPIFQIDWEHRIREGPMSQKGALIDAWTVRVIQRGCTILKNDKQLSGRG